MNRGKENWDRLMGALRLINPNILYSGEFSLLITRSKGESDAENYIHNLPTFGRLPPSQLLHNRHTWASDGSMVPASAGLNQNHSVTAALTGPKTVVICLNGHNLLIMHGEHIGMIMGLILSSPEHDTANEINHNNSNWLRSNHLITVRFVKDA